MTLHTLLLYGRGIGYSNSESGDPIGYRAAICRVGNNEYFKNCERSVSKSTCVTRLGAGGSVKVKRATVYKLIPVTYNIIQKKIKMTGEGANLPPALTSSTLSPDSINDQNYHRPLSNQK
jgi:hypothetical protein